MQERMVIGAFFGNVQRFPFKGDLRLIIDVLHISNVKSLSETARNCLSWYIKTRMWRQINTKIITMVKLKQCMVGQRYKPVVELDQASLADTGTIWLEAQLFQQNSSGGVPPQR